MPAVKVTAVWVVFITVWGGRQAFEDYCCF